MNANEVIKLENSGSFATALLKDATNTSKIEFKYTEDISKVKYIFQIFDFKFPFKKLIEEIKSQSFVEKAPEAIFFTELVLNVDRKELIINTSDDEYADEEKNIEINITSPMKSKKTTKKNPDSIKFLKI
jgi:hypothetical protein